ncbi:hypothetical protein QUA81_06130 [Microcoleus sp. F6_B4]
MGIGNWELGIGHGAWGIGHELVVGYYLFVVIICYLLLVGSNNQFSMPDARCPMPHARCPKLLF